MKRLELNIHYCAGCPYCMFFEETQDFWCNNYDEPLYKETVKKKVADFCQLQEV